MDPRQIRWGVLSTANIGRRAVVPAITASRNGQVVAVASRSIEAANRFGDATGIPRRYGSYQSLLDDADIDAIYLPLPNSLHREWTIRAAQAGKHVLSEKPLGLTAAECDLMDQAAVANGVRLMEAFMYRFHPRTEQVVRWVREGRIGELRAVRSAFTFRLSNPTNIRLDQALGGGALMDVGCYCVNVSRTLMGTEPVAAAATMRLGPSGVDLELAGILRFPGDATATFDCSLTAERREWYEAAGTDGTLFVPRAFLPGTNDAAIEESKGTETRSNHSVAGADQYRLMVEHFADAVQTGGPVRYPASEAAANLRVIEALYRSARAGGAPVVVEQAKR